MTTSTPSDLAHDDHIADDLVVWILNKTSVHNVTKYIFKILPSTQRSLSILHRENITQCTHSES